MNFFKKPYAYCIVYTIFIILLSAFLLLDTFVIPREYDGVDGEDFLTAEFTFTFGTSAPQEDVSTEKHTDNGVDSTESNAPVEDTPNGTQILPEDEPMTDTAAESVTQAVTDPPQTEALAPEEPIINDNMYWDENIKITFETVRYCNTDVHLAHVYVSSAEYFKTAIAKDKFGTNITQRTSVMAENKGAILAINGDYYGANKKGYVIKNGELYRNTVRSDDEYDDLVVRYDGSFDIINENDISAQDLLNSGVYQLFGFGPVLVDDSEIKVSTNDEVGQAMSSNPRTALGIAGDLHYVFVVSDGRTKNNEGLSLFDLAQFMKDQGCYTAYNLDGGGSSTMYFNGKIVNNPVASGGKTSERYVSDIVYIGY